MKKLNLKFFTVLFFMALINCMPVHALHRLALDVQGGTYELGELDDDDVIVPFYTWFSNSIETEYLDTFCNLPERVLIHCENEEEYKNICDLACNLSKLDSKLEYMCDNVSYDNPSLVTVGNDFERYKKNFFGTLLNILYGQNPYATCVIV